MKLWLCTQCHEYPAAVRGTKLLQRCELCLKTPGRKPKSRLLEKEPMLIELRQKGYSIQRLADEAKMSHGAIQHWYYTRGKSLIAQQGLP